MIQVNRIYLIFNRLVTKKFLVDTSEFLSSIIQFYSFLFNTLSPTGNKSFWAVKYGKYFLNIHIVTGANAMVTKNITHTLLEYCFTTPKKKLCVPRIISEYRPQ